MIKERPIPFTGPVVRAILDGSKTQTRDLATMRVCGNKKIPVPISDDVEWATKVADNPYGQPGDRLWVRETWYCDHWQVQKGPFLEVSEAKEMLVYRADGEQPYEAEQPVWRPSIHMPRWASRILLEIVSVRVERLQDISEADAIAEGVEPHEVGQFAMHGLNAEERAEMRRQAAIGPYSGLWDRINGAGSWDANPWVWVVEFKRLTP
jgi:hypothetical protein